MMYIGSIIIIIGIALFFKSFFDRQFAEALPVSVCTINILLYFFTLFIPLDAASVIVWVLGIAGLGFAAVKETMYVKANGFAIKRYLSYPFLFFILICAVIYGITVGARAYEWDEFSHWMLVSKNMHFFKNFGVTGEATTVFKGYPPATGIFNVFFTILSDFQEDLVFMGMSVSIVALSFIVFKDNSNTFGKSLIVFLIAVLSPFFGNAKIYGTLYVDGILGISFGCMLYTYFSEKKTDLFTFISLVLAATRLSLIKASGVALFAFGAIIILVDLLAFNKDKLSGKNLTSIKLGKKVFSINSAHIFLIAAVVVPLLINKTWSVYLSVNDLDEAWDTSPITLEAIAELFTDNIPEYRKSTISVFETTFFGTRTFFPNIIPGSYFTVPLAVTLPLLYCGKIHGEFKRSVCMSSLLCGSYYIYSISLLVLYLFTYDEREATSVASFARYMCTILCGILIFVIFVLVNPSNVFRENGENVKDGHKALKLSSYAALVFVLAATSGDSAQVFLKSEDNIKNGNLREAFNFYFDDTSDSFDYHNDKVYYISQNSKGKDYWIYKYLMTPVSISPPHINSKRSWSKLNEVKPEDEEFYGETTVEEWGQELIDGKYTYVYVQGNSDDFVDQFGSIFAYGMARSNAYYKVEIMKDGSVQLFPVYNEDKLRETTEAIVYLDALRQYKDRFLILASVRDDSSARLTDGQAKALEYIGFEDVEEIRKLRNGYFCAIDRGKTAVCGHSGTDVAEAEFNMYGLDIIMKSAGYLTGDTVSIMINGTEYSQLSRGINIVVYDIENRQIYDSICIDTFEQGTPIERNTDIAYPILVE